MDFFFSRVKIRFLKLSKVRIVKMEDFQETMFVASSDTREVNNLESMGNKKVVEMIESPMKL